MLGRSRKRYSGSRSRSPRVRAGGFARFACQPRSQFLKAHRCASPATITFPVSVVPHRSSATSLVILFSTPLPPNSRAAADAARTIIAVDATVARAGRAAERGAVGRRDHRETMSNTTLSADEAAVLAAVLSRLAIRTRTGEVGVLHGLDRFVSTQLCLKKQELGSLASAATKLGTRVPETGK